MKRNFLLRIERLVDHASIVLVVLVNIFEIKVSFRRSALHNCSWRFCRPDTTSLSPRLARSRLKESKMNAKVVALLLALSMVLAVTAAEDEFDLFEMEDLMEKRRGGGGGGRRSKIGKCPYDTRCYCAKLRTGEWSERLMCGQANAANVGI